MEKEKKDDSYTHILKYTGIFGGVQGLNILVGVVRNKLVALLLGPEGMGLISLFNSSVKMMSDSSNLGIGMSAVREVSEAYEQGDEKKLFHVVDLVRMWSLLTALLGMVLCVVLSPLLNRFTFSWGDHTLHFVFLSPVIAMMALTAGELAILKGMRRLKSLAVISVYGMLGALVTSVPLFWIWGEAAIVPSIAVVALLQMLFTLFYSYRAVPWRFKFGRSFLGEGSGTMRKGVFGLIREGLGMIRLGVAFILAGILGSGAEFVIRSYLNYTSGLDIVGFYNTGFMMAMTYAGMVFQAMETDYFPRLSAVEGMGDEMNNVVNRQIEVSLLLVSPLLAIFIIASPLILQLLFSSKFLPVVGMMKIALLAMYFRAVSLPIEYIPLSKGDSRSYLLMEACYDVLLIGFVIGGFCLWSLEGTGVALAVLGFVNLLMVVGYMRWRYGYRLSKSVMTYFVIQLLLGLVAYAVSLSSNPWIYWGFGCLFSALSLVLSLKVLHSKTHLWHHLIARIRRNRGGQKAKKHQA